MSNYCVLGTGMAGFGAAHKLREEGITPVLFDKQDHFGGHTASYTFEGGKYTFDSGPHISFTKVERMQKLLADAIDGEYRVLKATVNNYWRGYWIKHPAQVNLYGLPPEVIVKAVTDFVAAKHRPAGEIRQYEDWLRASYGDYFAENFPMDYTIKYHTTPAANMSTDWIGPRLYEGSLEQVLFGALAPASPDVHYIDHFRYPVRGGFVSYLRRFMESNDLRLGHTLQSIDPTRKQVSFTNGAVVDYEKLISSVPLPELIPTIKGAPRDVVEAAQRLACSELVVVDLVIDRADLIDAHWTYFYDRDISFTRLSTPHMQSPNNMPPGCGAFQAEVYFSPKYRPLDRKPEDCIQPVIDDLRRVGLIREEDKVLFSKAMHVKYANVIFDLERAASVETVHGYLNDIGVHYCGRYGDWAYIWTDESFMSGENAVEKALTS